jgi:bile acid-coenzyme A ligase
VSSGDSTRGLSFGARLTQLAQEDPSRVAVTFVAADGTSSELTTEQLDNRSNQVARVLSGQGVRSGDVVVVGLGNNPRHLFSTFGAWKLGASVLPLRYDLPPWETQRLLSISRPSAVIADWPGLDSETLSSAWVGATSSADGAPVDMQTPECASMIATSGSTGHPKILVVPNPGVYDPSMDAEAMIPSEGSVFMTTCPMYHANGFRFCYPPILSGSDVVLMERFDAALVARTIERYRVTHTTMVPTMLQRILRLDDVRDYDFSSLRQLIYGAAPIPDWVVRGWLELIPPEAFVLVYGSSENVGIISTDGRNWLAHPGTAGLPMNCDLKIVDADYRELPAGQIGAIYVRPHRAGTPFRYIGVETPAPTEDGYWTLGDLGYRDEDGFLFVVERRQDLINSGGANVYPAEVEAALSELSSVADVVVIGLPDPEWGQRVHAVVQPTTGSTIDPAELRTYLKERIAGYKVPKSYEIVDSLPRTAAGKLNRSALIEERTKSLTR